MTNPKNNTSNLGRRSFLLKAATVAAGSAALTVAASAGSSVLAYQNGPDPILRAIENHRAAHAGIESALRVMSALEEELPSPRNYDERWLANERDITAAWGAADDAEMALLTIHPTTQAGILALLRYTLDHDADGHGWGGEYLSDDGTRTRGWYYFLIESVAEAMTQLT